MYHYSLSNAVLTILWARCIDFINDLCEIVCTKKCPGLSTSRPLDIDENTSFKNSSLAAAPRYIHIKQFLEIFEYTIIIEIHCQLYSTILRLYIREPKPSSGQSCHGSTSSVSTILIPLIRTLQLSGEMCQNSLDLEWFFLLVIQNEFVTFYKLAKRFSNAFVPFMENENENVILLFKFRIKFFFHIPEVCDVYRITEHLKAYKSGISTS